MVRSEAGSDGTRERIKAAALAAFCQDGFERANMRAIAEAAGVQVSVVYYYFEGKEELYTEVVLDGIVELFAELRGKVDFGRSRKLAQILADLLAVRSPANLTERQAALYRISILEWMGHRGDRPLTRKLHDMIAASRSAFLAGLERRADATGEGISPLINDLLYRYLEYETLRMLFGVAPFDRVRAERDLGHLLGETP